jgi:hypothetical protein
LLIPGIVSDSLADSRDDIKRAEKQIEIIEKRIAKLEVKVSEQREEIIKNENQLESDKTNLKNLKKSSNTSWTHLEKIIAAEDKIEESKRIVSASNPSLISLLTSINGQEKLIELQEDKIKLLEDESKRIIVDSKELIKKDDSKPETFDTSGYVKKIGIKLSSVCTIALKNNVTNPCGISYKNLITLDSSNTDISGKFTTEDNGFFHRGTSQVKNDCRVYDGENQLRLFIDPSNYCETRIKMIEILPNFETYIVNSEKYQDETFEVIDVMVNATFGNVTQSKTIQVLNSTSEAGQIIFHDRFIDKSCKTAKINSDMWKILLPDTIRHMRQNCEPGTTNYNIREFIPANNTEYNRNESRDWKALQEIEDSKVRCKSLCFDY